jgi:hypothetical protein
MLRTIVTGGAALVVGALLRGGVTLAAVGLRSFGVGGTPTSASV